ncbi:MAG: hypothetical protein ACOX7F_02210 [Eubacteriales bacterium]|jgi:hypothetical protein
MDHLLTLLLEIILDGALEAADSKQVPLPVRILLGALLALLFFGITGLLLWVGIDSGNLMLAGLGVVFLLISLLLLIPKIRRLRKGK